MSRILVFLYFWIKLDYYLLKLIILEYLERVSQQHMVHLFWMVKLVTIHKSPIWTWNSYLFQIFSSDSKFSSNFTQYLCLNWICLNIPWIFFWIYTCFFFQSASLCVTFNFFATFSNALQGSLQIYHYRYR
jgi:hypothetical protein